MVLKGRLSISLEETGGLNFRKPELLKSGSNDRCRKSYRRRIREMDPVCRPLFKTSNEQDEVEDGEFADTLRKAELLDHYNCIWLSSDGASSPTSCSLDDGLFGPMDLKIDAWLISLLSTPSSSPRSAELLSTEATFFDGSRVNPIEEASLVLDQRKIAEKDVAFREDLEEEEDEVISWLETSIKNESQDTDEDAESSYGRSSVKDSTELNEFYFLLSKCTLDKRASEFSTPVTKTKSYQLSTSSVSSITDSSDDWSSDYSSEVVDLEEIGIDKPLFWPSDWESDWSSDTKSDFFPMSPRKSIRKDGNSPKTSHRSLNPRVPNGEGKPYLANAQNPRHKTHRFAKISSFPHLVFLRLPMPVTNTRYFLHLPMTLQKSHRFSGQPVIPPIGIRILNGIPSLCLHEKTFTKLMSQTPLQIFRLRARNAKRIQTKLQPKARVQRLEKHGIRLMLRPRESRVRRENRSVKHKIVLEDLLLVEKLNVEGGAIEEVLGLKNLMGMKD
ncbi:hypothetical protein OSB04_010028 [Centaurea solstitialis]|uniref:Uncharacterized protein n=1 Tax=Centaurea solstitialis TaxID=347529 RepID=A0AA38T8F3_9ASTR|nr:hypothetical protein OSB04_010028 [Centaurea solstitialis]